MRLVDVERLRSRLVQETDKFHVAHQTLDAWMREPRADHWIERRWVMYDEAWLRKVVDDIYGKIAI